MDNEGKKETRTGDDQLSNQIVQKNLWEIIVIVRNCSQEKRLRPLISYLKKQFSAYSFKISSGIDRFLHAIGKVKVPLVNPSSRDFLLWKLLERYLWQIDVSLLVRSISHIYPYHIDLFVLWRLIKLRDNIFINRTFYTKKFVTKILYKPSTIFRTIIVINNHSFLAGLCLFNTGNNIKYLSQRLVIDRLKTQQLIKKQSF